MKNVFRRLIFFFFLLGNTALFGQNSLDKASVTVCDCISKVEMDQPLEVLNKTMEKCMQEAFLKNMSELTAEYHVDVSDQDQLYKLGVDIGKKLVVSCPKFIDYSMRLAEDKKDAEKEKIKGTTEGKFSKLDVKDFAYLVVKEKSGKESSFLWLHHFADSEKFMQELEKLKGKALRIEWQEYEAYLPKANGYYKIKEVVSVQVIN